ncbi:MAG: sigma-70 family RNA polymerase sigma factor [Oscillospiraceae bacterium]|nr:sigma-70 family RNA polymerase sigma factor [Oscillospiraceae bacterium]
MKDEKIIKLMKRKDEKGLDKLIDKYSKYVCTIIRRIICPFFSEEDVEEVAADVFLAIWNNSANMTSDNIQKYIAATARNKSISKRRTYHSSLSLNEDSYISDECVEIEIEKKLESEEITLALNQMNPDDKTLLVQTYYYCRPLAETAELLNISAGAAKTRLFRARKKLKDILIEGGLTYENRD